jgi:P2 family phage contractile tail tube protein
MSNLVPERTINYKVYDSNSKALMGLATIELPEIAALTDTVSGAGIAGEVDSPTIGHTGSLETTLTFRTIEAAATSLSAPKAHAIDCRSSQQVYDSANGVYKTVPVRVSMRGITKSSSLGSLEINAATDTEVVLEVVYLKIWIDNKERVEIDKYNYKYVVDGVDYLAQTRRDMGM